MPYVIALYQQAIKEKDLNYILIAASAVSKALHSNSELSSFLKIPFIPFEEKISILETLVPKENSTLFISFLTLLGHNRKLDSAEVILTKFLEYADHKSGCEHIHVRSAFTLDTPTKQMLQEAIETQLQKKIKISITLDRTLIGGIIIHYYHQELDLSVRNGILSLKSELRKLYS